MLEIRSSTWIFTKTYLKTRMMIFKLSLFFADWVLKMLFHLFCSYEFTHNLIILRV